MSEPDFLDPRLTERRNADTTDIDTASSLDLVDLLSAEDQRVPRVVHEAREELARVIDLVVSGFRSGGRLIYVGAGTSGRLGVLDAAECPPTFGTSPDMVVGVIAGGAAALTRSQEGAEDDKGSGAAAVDDLAVGSDDVVIGIAASGTTPYVGAALKRAHDRGSAVVLVTCAQAPADILPILAEVVMLRVGPEALTGSTRLKAGTATKLALNTITTGSMIRLGKAYGNLMVDLVALSDKLRDRGERIVMETCGVGRVEARETLEAAEGSVKRAIVMIRRAVGPDDADRLLKEAGGFVRHAVGDPPPVIQ